MEASCLIKFFPQMSCLLESSDKNSVNLKIKLNIDDVQTFKNVNMNFKHHTK